MNTKFRHTATQSLAVTQVTERKPRKPRGNGGLRQWIAQRLFPKPEGFCLF